MKPPRTAPIAPRVPFPQTPATAHAWIRAHGINLAEMARHHRVPRETLSDLLRGKQKGNRGLAHRCAILLGLKADPSHAAEGETGMKHGTPTARSGRALRDATSAQVTA